MGERQTETHQAEHWIDSLLDKFRGALTSGAVGPDDIERLREEWEARVAELEAERTTDGMGHVWTEESDLDRLDELEAEVVRLRAERNIALDRAKGWRDRATAAEARVAELEAERGRTVAERTAEWSRAYWEWVDTGDAGAMAKLRDERPDTNPGGQ